jgi:hypothetical protein
LSERDIAVPLTSIHTGKLDKLSNSSASSSQPHKIGNGKNKNSEEDIITITERVNLTKNQHQALKIVCDIYQQSFSEYIHQALVQTMKSDIEDGNLSISLLERLDDDPREGETDDKKGTEKGIDSMSYLDELTALNKLSKPK